MKNLKKLASLLLSLVMIFTFAFTGTAVFADDSAEEPTAATLTVTPATVEMGGNTKITITVTGGEGGLSANTSYNIRLTKTSATVNDSGFGKSGPYQYTFADGGTYPSAATVTTDANGGFTKEVILHQTKITETGVYAYCIMDSSWSTKAVANFEVVEMGDRGSFTNTQTEFYVGKAVKLTYENLDLSTYGTPDIKLYKWQEGWSYNADRSSFLSGSYQQLTSATGTVSFSASQMEGFGGEGTYVAVLAGQGYTKFAELIFTYVPNPKGMTIADTTVYRGEMLKLELYGAQSGDAVAVFAKGVPNYTTLGGSYRALTTGQTAVWIETSGLAPGEYTVGLWASGWDFNGRINITVEKLDNDINYDARVDISDLVRLKKMAAGITTVADDADLNEDSEVNGTDAAILRKAILGLE